MPRANKNQDGRESRGVRRDKSGTIADYGSCDANKLLHAIETAARCGGALRFGYTSDGGAYAIGIYGDGDPYTEYVKPSEDLNLFLDDVITLFEEIQDDRSMSKVSRKA